MYVRTGYRGAAPSSSMNSVSMSRSVVAPARHHDYLDDSSQLDDILKELLGDQHDAAPSTTMKGSRQNEGSITTHSGNSRTVVSWQTSQSGPQRSVTSSTYSMQRPVADGSLAAKEPFSYGAGAHSTSTYEETRHSTTSSMQRPTTPARFAAHSNGGYQNFEYLTEGEQSWLQEQQQKLQSMKDHRDMPRRTEQERKLVAELKSAQSTLTRRRAESEAEEDAVVQQYAKKDRNVFAPNGPAYAVTPSPTSPPQIDHAERSEKNYFVSGIERPPFTTHQTKYTFSVSPPQSGTTRPGNKPPVGRFSAPGSPVVPVRGVSSQEAVVRTRTISARDYQMNGNDPFTPSTSAVVNPVTSSQIFSRYQSEQTTTTPCVDAPQVSAELQAPLPKPPAVEEPIVKAVASRKSEGNSVVEVS